MSTVKRQPAFFTKLPLSVAMLPLEVEGLHPALRGMQGSGLCSNLSPAVQARLLQCLCVRPTSLSGKGPVSSEMTRNPKYISRSRCRLECARHWV